MTQRPRSPVVRPLDAAKLRDLALHYVARYATSAAKLSRYLQRKVRERGWDGNDPPDIAGIVAGMVEAQYLDDDQFAEMRASGLLRRGYGARRVSATLRADGIADPTIRRIAAIDPETARDAALAFARRRRFGPFATIPPDAQKVARELQAMMRAGHDFSVSRQILALAADFVQDD